MTLRNFTAQDRATVLAMVETFYHSPGVLHPIPISHFANAFAEMCDGGSPLQRGILITADDGRSAGYCLLSFTYSVEAGGKVVLIEEIYIDAPFRGQGLGEQALNWIKSEYHGQAARLRLEVAPNNTAAARLYQRLGYEKLDYVQMILEDF